MYDNKNSIPRKVYGFYRKEELLKIIARRNEKITANDISINMPLFLCLKALFLSFWHAICLIRK